jgi:hypothetical protein
MHYGDEHQAKNQKLRIVVYKHGVAGKVSKPEYKPDGLLKRNSVSYQIASIQECHLFDVGILYRMMKDPYKYLNKALSDKPFEEWMELEITSPDYDKIEVLSVTNVSKHPDDSKRLH